MKVLKDVDLGSQEVEIEVSGEEMWSTVRCDLSVPENIGQFMRIANLTNAVFGKMPDAMIAELNEHQRKTVSEFFSKQAERFKV